MRGRPCVGAPLPERATHRRAARDIFFFLSLTKWPSSTIWACDSSSARNAASAASSSGLGSGSSAAGSAMRRGKIGNLPSAQTRPRR